ncbi:unnamed protein product [Paramecium pentaurelia]|uniref:Transmembrane protein n=1 Tax=Paramecium pentaurelia TaxID=43138 RepID=A0A8S1YD87_9CILI|nr:unnamed protein product [Paramecium pentaurelia]
MIILILLPIVYLGFTLEHCSIKQEQVKALFSTQETFEWNLKDFFSGSYLNYTLSTKQSYFTLKKPLHQEYAPKLLIEGISKIIAIQARTEQNQNVWLNHFAFIEKNLNQLSIYYSEGLQGDFRPPYFNQKIVFSLNQDIQCLNLEYLNDTSFLADCYNGMSNPIQNYFFIVDKSGAVRNVSNNNYGVQNMITKRITKIINFADSKKNSIKLLFRSTPAYATGSDLKKNCIIEIYNASSLQLIDTLTAFTIGTLLEIDDPFDYEFNLIDFELFADGRLYILTAFDGIIILQMDQWLGFTLIDRIELLSDAREFDVGHFISSDGSIQEVIGVLFTNKAEIYENRIFKYSYDLDFTPVYTTLLKISQELLIIQNKGKTYLINIQTQDLVYKEVLEGIQGLLINQYFQELIYVTQIDARRFTLSSGKIKFLSGELTASKAILTITAKDQFNDSCYATIVYGIQNSSDSKIYPLSDLEFPDVYHDYPLISEFQIPVSGPNIQYNHSSLFVSDVEGINTINLNIKSGGIINAESIYSKIPSAKSSQYIKLISLDDDDSRIAIIFQESSTKDILAYICSTDQYNDGQVNLQCINYMKFPISINLENRIFQSYFDEENLYFLIVENNYTVVMYSVSQLDIQYQQQFVYNSTAQIQIKSINVVANRLYVVLSNQQLDIWNLLNKQQYTITEAKVRALGFYGSWKLQKIVGNSRYHPSILFIINNDNIIIADYHKELTIIKVLTYKESTMDVAISKDSFFVVVHTSTKTQIIEYDFSNYCNVFQMKELPTYRYKVQTSLAIATNQDSGLLYIAASDPDNEDLSVILVYKPRQPLRDSLVKVLSPKRQTFSIVDTQIAAAGFKQFIFYQNDGVNHNMGWIDKIPQYQIVPTYQTNQWVNKFRLNLTMWNLKYNPSITLSQAIVLYQSKTQIKFQNANQDVFIEKWKKSEIDIDMTGTIVDYLIQCQQCGQGKNIDIVQPLRLYDQEVGENLNVVDQFVLQGQTNPDIRLVLLSINDIQAIKVYNKDNQFVKNIIISTNPNTRCQRIQMNWIYILVTCVVDNQYQIATIQCTSNYTCGDQIKFSPLQVNISYIPQFHLNDYNLAFINTFPMNVKSNDTQLNYYTISFSNTTYVATYTLSKQISSVQLYNEHFVKVMVHNLYSYGSYSYFLTLTEEGKFRIFNIGLGLVKTFVLSDIIIQNGGEITYQQFTDFTFISNPTYSSYTGTIDILFTSQSLNYKFQLVYDSYNQNVISFTYNYALSRYLHAQVLPGLFIDRQLFQVGIPYRYNNNIVISIYQLPNNSVSDQRIVYSQGGVSQYHDFTNPNKVVAFSLYNKVLMVGLSQNYLDQEFILKYYNVDLRYILQVDDVNGKLYDQEVALQMSNDLCSDSLLYKIKITSNEFQDQQDDLNSNETNKRIQ